MFRTTRQGKVLCWLVCAVTVLSARAADAQKAGITSLMIPAEREAELARSAAPASVSGGAGIYVFGAKGYTQVVASRNGFTCLVNRDSFLEGYEVLKPTCWDAQGTRTIVPAVLEIGRMKAAGVPAKQIAGDVRAMFKAGKFTLPDHTGIAYMLAGDLLEYDVATGKIGARDFPPHVMLYAQNIAEPDLGIDMGSALKDARAPLMYQSAVGFKYVVVRVPAPAP